MIQKHKLNTNLIQSLETNKKCAMSVSTNATGLSQCSWKYYNVTYEYHWTQYRCQRRNEYTV